MLFITLSNFSFNKPGLFPCIDTIIFKSFKIFSNLCFNNIIWSLYTFIKDSILTEDFITESLRALNWLVDISTHSAILFFNSSFSLFNDSTLLWISLNFFSCSSNCTLHLFSESIFSSNNLEYSSSFLFISFINILFSDWMSFIFDWYSSIFFALSSKFCSKIFFSFFILFNSVSKFFDFISILFFNSSTWDKRKLIVWFFSFISKFILSMFFAFSMKGSKSFTFCSRLNISSFFCCNCDKYSFISDSLCFKSNFIAFNFLSLIISVSSKAFIFCL